MTRRTRLGETRRGCCTCVKGEHPLPRGPGELSPRKLRSPGPPFPSENLRLFASALRRRGQLPEPRRAIRVRRTRNTHVTKGHRSGHKPMAQALHAGRAAHRSCPPLARMHRTGRTRSDGPAREDDRGAPSRAQGETAWRGEETQQGNRSGRDADAQQGAAATPQPTKRRETHRERRAEFGGNNRRCRQRSRLDVGSGAITEPSVEPPSGSVEWLPSPNGGLGGGHVPGTLMGRNPYLLSDWGSGAKG